jgi:predicted Zn finger-like uncharacterized protein
MPQMGPIPEGKSFFCPHCGALYAVTQSRQSSKSESIVKCVVCYHIIDKGDSAKVSIYKLTHRPDDV